MSRSTTSCVLDNEGALAIPEVPKKLGVVGAGVIGLEMGSVWRRLGAEVTMLEALPALLAAVDVSRSRRKRRSSSRSRASPSSIGVKITDVKVACGKDVTVDYADAAGKPRTAHVRPPDRLDRPRAEHRRPRCAEASGSQLDERGFVAVDDDCRTNLPNVWAIGDVVRGPMLAHKAEEEGVAVAERIAGQQPHVDFNTIPVGDLHLARDRVGRARPSSS